MPVTIVPDIRLNIAEVVALLGGTVTPYGTDGNLFHLEVATWPAMLVLHEVVEGRPGIEPITRPLRFPGRDVWRLSVSCDAGCLPVQPEPEPAADDGVRQLDRAIRLGVSLLELGETVDDTREQLLRWRFTADVVEVAVPEAVRRRGGTDDDDSEGKVEDFGGSVMRAEELRQHLDEGHGVRTADLSDPDLPVVHQEQHPIEVGAELSRAEGPAEFACGYGCGAEAATEQKINEHYRTAHYDESEVR